MSLGDDLFYWKYLTGTVLLKEFERDFAMKKDLDSITKLNPGVRLDKLHQLMDKIKRNPDAKLDFDSWQMQFSQEVVKVNATIMVPITIQYNDVIWLFLSLSLKALVYINKQRKVIVNFYFGKKRKLSPTPREDGRIPFEMEDICVLFRSRIG
jgi:hypothetical protein